MKRHLIIIIALILSVSVIYSQNNGSETIIKNVYLIDGNGNEPILNSIKITNGKIIEINSFEQLGVTDSATIIDGTGKYIIPGLIDSHVHVMMGGDEAGQKKLLLDMLKTGVTTVQDLVGDARDLAYYSKQQKRGIITSPEIHFAAMFTTADFMKKDFRMQMFPDGQQGELPFLQAVNDGTDFKKAIARAHGTGATAIKLYAGLTQNIIKNLTVEGHKIGMKVWSHAAHFPLTVNAIKDIEIDVFCHAGLLAYNSTNVPSEYHVWLENLYKDEHYQVFPENLNVDTILKTMVQKDIILDATLLAWKYSDKSFELALKIVKRAHELDVKITTGTDIEGFPTLEELYLLVELVGLSPKEALMSSSRNGAQAIGIDKTHGTIEVGKVANLILLNENPLINIRNIETINTVFMNGNSIDFD